MESAGGFMRRMATQMYDKFSKYWSEFSLILTIAVVLDPCFKMQFVEFSYMKLYGSGNIETILVREKLVSLFDEYVHNSPTPKTSSGKDIGKAIKDTGPIFGAKGSRDMLKELHSFQCQESYSMRKSQLDMYLDEPRLEWNSNMDVLSFWKVNQFRYPELSHMACDILSIPISTVASESAFSINGNIHLSLDDLTEDIIDVNDSSSAQYSKTNDGNVGVDDIGH